MRNTIRISEATFGLIVAMAGFEHGVGEVLQGNVAPAARQILSWPNSPAFAIIGGEPAMTLIPSYLFSGVLAMAVSLVIAVWSVAFLHRKAGGPVLIGLSAVLLLFGGGFAPPVLGGITGLGAFLVQILLRRRWGRPGGLLKTLGALWPWAYAACLASWLMCFPGLVILAAAFGVNDPGLVIVFSVLALGLWAVTFLTEYVAERTGQSQSGASLAGGAHAAIH